MFSSHRMRVTVAAGSTSDELCIDDDCQTIVIADGESHRIVQSKIDENTRRQVVVDGRDHGNRSDQLHCPSDVIIDKETDRLVIVVWKNR